MQGLTEFFRRHPEVEEYIDSTSAEPAMYESATYDAMAELVAEKRFDMYIFNMPPFGHGVRMIAMADILSKWVEKITTFTNLITDQRRTAFFMVLIPEKMAILDTERALSMFRDLGIRMSGLIVNQIYPRALLDKPNLSQFLRHRVLMQQEHFTSMQSKFGEHLCAALSMYPREPKGLEMIARVSEDLMRPFPTH